MPNYRIPQEIPKNDNLPKSYYLLCAYRWHCIPEHVRSLQIIDYTGPRMGNETTELSDDRSRIERELKEMAWALDYLPEYDISDTGVLVAIIKHFDLMNTKGQSYERTAEMIAMSSSKFSSLIHRLIRGYACVTGWQLGDVKRAKGDPDYTHDISQHRKRELEGRFERAIAEYCKYDHIFTR